MKPLTLAGQISQLEDALAHGRSVRLYSVTYRLLGAVVLGVVVWQVFIFGANAPADDRLRAWLECLVFALPTGLVGWLTGARPYVEVGESGLRVRNPLNDAFVPWSAIERVEGDGLSVRIHTREWSVGVWAIEKANRERTGSSRAEQFATVIEAEAKRRGGDDGAGSEPWKHWLRSYGAVCVPVVIAGAAFVWIVARG